MHRNRTLSRFNQCLEKLRQKEKVGSILIILCLFFALFMANTPLSVYYHKILNYVIAIPLYRKHYLAYSVHEWINSGLMSIFFFAIGLELKREILIGELSNPRKSITPVFAAIGGMICPAIIYYLFNPSGEMRRGWGIPMATDIAFAISVLSLLGDRVPKSLKVFLTALAIVDDLGAIIVIALFYGGNISLGYLLIALLSLIVLFLANKYHVKSLWIYLGVGVLGVWFPFLMSGMDATIGAVLVAFTIPILKKKKRYNNTRKNSY